MISFGVRLNEQIFSQPNNQLDCYGATESVLSQSYPCSLAGRQMPNIGYHSCRHLGIFLCFSHCHKGWRGSDAAAERKSLKYASITNTHIFVPVAIETLGPICSRELSFLVKISNCLAAISDDATETSFLFQWVSVLIQRFTQIAFRGTCMDGNDTEGSPLKIWF